MKYLGIDYGLKRVGLAISEGDLASPFKVIEINGLKDGVEQILRIVKSENIDKVVVGLPGAEMGKAVMRFVNLLKTKGIDVEVADETLSTKNATKLMVDMGISREKRKINDAYSAAEILQEYLDNVIASSEMTKQSN